jgi:predicted transcriptional regulator
MPVFQDAKEQADYSVMVNLLKRLSEDPSTTQRSLAVELGVALGLISRYIKSCMHKGYLRAKQVAPRRWAYFVTSKGFAEKSRMAVHCLSHAMTFFREARTQLEALFLECQKKGFCSIALVGEGDLAEIAKLVSCGLGISVTVMHPNEDLSGFDGILITDLYNAQVVYDDLKEKVEKSELLTIPLLSIAVKRVRILDIMRDHARSPADFLKKV